MRERGGDKEKDKRKMYSSENTDRTTGTRQRKKKRKKKARKKKNHVLTLRDTETSVVKHLSHKTFQDKSKRLMHTVQAGASREAARSPPPTSPTPTILPLDATES